MKTRFDSALHKPVSGSGVVGFSTQKTRWKPFHSNGLGRNDTGDITEKNRCKVLIHKQLRPVIIWGLNPGMESANALMSPSAQLCRALGIFI